MSARARHEDCRCPRAVHVHGSRTTYIVHGCRCDDCRRANSAETAKRNRAKLYGRYDKYVDGDPVREHLRWLSMQGMGWKNAARAAGVATSTVYAILYGKLLDQPDHPEHRPPRKRVFRHVGEALLAVQPVLADGAKVDATGTHRRIQALVAVGWSQSKIGARLGITPGNFHKMMQSVLITEGTRKAVAALYDELWDKRPPEANHRDKIAANRARNYAKAHRWVPPMAWDDGAIDDPTASPADDSDVTVDKAAELRWVLSQYENPDHAAARLGISRAGLQKRMERHGVDYPPHMAAFMRDHGNHDWTPIRRAA